MTKKKKLSAKIDELVKLTDMIKTFVSPATSPGYISLFDLLEKETQEAKKLACNHPAFGGGLCAVCGCTYAEAEEMDR